jgi:UDP-glucose 4-epimerase
MKILVTGSAGHLGEALLRQLAELGHSDAVGIDILASPYTTHIGSVSDREVGSLYAYACTALSSCHSLWPCLSCVGRDNDMHLIILMFQFIKECMRDVEVVYHTATLHKPHVATHTRQQFVDTNIAGTLCLLEEAAALPHPPVFVFTSTTSLYGDALEPASSEPGAVWITEETIPIPKNIYGVTKLAAEDLCQLFHRNQGLPCIVLRTSRFFPEADDNEETRLSFSDQNSKANEYLHRRIEVQDCINAHLRAAEKAREIGFGKYIISATTPFKQDREELISLRSDPAAVVRKRIPIFEKAYRDVGWKMADSITRVYDNSKARIDLDWAPKYDFEYICKSLIFQKHFNDNEPASEKSWDISSPRSLEIGRKYYHESERGKDEASRTAADAAPYPVGGSVPL